MAIVTVSHPAVKRLAEVLGINPNSCTGMTLDIHAGDFCRLEVSRILTVGEIEALSEWFVTEGISPIQIGTTTYSLERREQADGDA